MIANKLTTIVVLEQWDIALFHLRLVSDGLNIWLEYQPIFSNGPKFWRIDEGITTCAEEDVRRILPHFSEVQGITIMNFDP